MVYQHTFKEETHMKNKKNIMMKVVRNSITKIAEKKAYANCISGKSILLQQII